MHINDFYANGVDMVVMEITVICLSCISGGKPRRPLSWVDTVLFLVLRRDGRVRYGMRDMSRDVSICCLKYMHCFANHAGYIKTS